MCYCLGITAVDPIRMELLFERFLSEGRKEPPDIDIDFAHRDRERVLQYVYNRYGREHAAMVCEQITWRGRSAVRDAARVLGFSVQQGDMLASLSDRFSARSTAEALRVNKKPTANTPGAESTSKADRIGQQMLGGTEATTKARVVREASRKVASTQTKSSTKSSADARAQPEPVTHSDHLSRAGLDPND